MTMYRTIVLDGSAPPSLARVSPDGKWERYNYGQDQWFPANATSGEVLYSGDWEICTVGDALRHIDAYQPDRRPVITP